MLDTLTYRGDGAPSFFQFKRCYFCTPFAGRTDEQCEAQRVLGSLEADAEEQDEEVRQADEQVCPAASGVRLVPRPPGVRALSEVGVEQTRCLCAHRLGRLRASRGARRGTTCTASGYFWRMAGWGSVCACASRRVSLS